jgi:adenosylcobinamide-phosphate synthase
MTPLDPRNLYLLLAALTIEAAFGYPEPLYRAIRHPVVWLGALIAGLDRALNLERFDEGARRWLGVVALVLVLEAVACVTLPLALALGSIRGGWLVAALLAATLLSQRSLHRHVGDVARALEAEGLEAGRRAVAKIVGRDPQSLDQAGVCRAAIESLAENLSDGVVAPAFWAALGGLPAMALYKAINTADSMIGHRSARYRAFGWAAARLDDLVNWPAARLTSFLLLLAATTLPQGRPGDAWRAIWRDARRHRSPNAGWCEAAMAGALGLRLAGPRLYGGERIPDAWMGEGRAEATPDDIRRALQLYRRACLALWILLAAGAAALALHRGGKY